MKIKLIGGVILLILLFCLLIPIALAAPTVSISQAGADPGTVMKGKTFTVTVSGLSGSGTVELVDLPTGISPDPGEGTSKAFGAGTTSVSWTTVTASQTLTATKIKATVTVAGSPQTAESSTFDVILPPSIVASVDPTSTTVNKGSSYDISLSIQNWGETTAKDVVVTLSLGSGMSIVSGTSPQTISTIAGGAGGSGESVGRSWTISTSTVGTFDTQISIVPSNAGSTTKTVSVTVSPVCGDGV